MTHPDITEPAGGAGDAAPLPAADALDQVLSIPPTRRVLVVIEDRVAADAAVDTGLELARTQGADVLFLRVPAHDVAPVLDVTVMSAGLGESLERELHEQAEDALEVALASAQRAGVSARSATMTAVDAARGVADAALEHDCDLIVVATEGSNAVVRLLTGSLIPGLITVAPVPLLVCPPHAPDAPGRGRRRAAAARRRRRAGAAEASTTLDRDEDVSHRDAR